MSVVVSQLRAGLRAAIAARDGVAVSAHRSALAAIGNAEAVAPPSERIGSSSPHFAGAVAGLGAAEAQRRVVSDAEAAQIVQAEIQDRDAAARQYDQAGRRDEADRLRREAEILPALLAQGRPAQR
jgi:uncharacterized protein